MVGVTQAGAEDRMRWKWIIHYCDPKQEHPKVVVDWRIFFFHFLCLKQTVSRDTKRGEKKSDSFENIIISFHTQAKHLYYILMG